MIEPIKGTTRVTGVFGFPVKHSKSPLMHNAAFQSLNLDIIYAPFEVHPDNLEAAVKGIRGLGIMGVNLTIPHKEEVFKYLDWVSDEAKLINSVNTIHNVEGVLKGYSSDGVGFIEALKSSEKSPKGAKAVVLGAGGSARATVYALAVNGADVVIANRTPERAVEVAKMINKALNKKEIMALPIESAETRKAVEAADLLVNCTSVGMYPKPDAQPIPTEWLHSRLFVYDQIYNPLETKLMKSAKSVGAKTANGVKMLVYQGAVSFEIWTGQKPPIELMEEAVLNSLEIQ